MDVACAAFVFPALQQPCRGLTRQRRRHRMHAVCMHVVPARHAGSRSNSGAPGQHSSRQCVLAAGQLEGPQQLQPPKQSGERKAFSKQAHVAATQTKLFATPARKRAQLFPVPQVPQQPRLPQQPRPPQQNRRSRAHSRQGRQEASRRQQKNRQGAAVVTAKAVPTSAPTPTQTYLPPPQRPVARGLRSGAKEPRSRMAASHVPKPPSHQRHRRMRVADHMHLLEQRQD